MPDDALFQRHAQHRLSVSRRLQFRQAGEHIVEPLHAAQRVGAMHENGSASQIGAGGEGGMIECRSTQYGRRRAQRTGENGFVTGKRPQAGGESRSRFRQIAGHLVGRGLIRLRHVDVETDSQWFQCRNGIDQAREPIPRPGPLTDGCQRLIVNLDNGHGLSSRNSREPTLILVEQELPGRFKGIRKRLVKRGHEGRTCYVARPFAGQVDEAQAEQHRQCNRTPLGRLKQIPDPG